MELKDYFLVGLIAFASVWLINRGLTAAGYSQYKA